jgi:hypothetical protein
VTVLVGKELEDGKKFGIWVGGYKEEQFTHIWSLQASIEEIFAKKPAARANIYKNLYLSGVFDEWVDGFGIVTVIDDERRNALKAEFEV